MPIRRWIPLPLALSAALFSYLALAWLTGQSPVLFHPDPRPFVPPPPPVPQPVPPPPAPPALTPTRPPARDPLADWTGLPPHP